MSSSVTPLPKISGPVQPIIDETKSQEALKTMPTQEDDDNESEVLYDEQLRPSIKKMQELAEG